MEPIPLNAIPEPWEYNPSNWKKRLQIVFLAAIAFFLAVYMGLYEWGLIDWVWDPIFNNGTMNVLSSDLSHEISEWIIIPDAILGALAYLGDILFALAGSTRRWFDRPWLVILFGISVIPVGIVSVILIILQGSVVGSWCFLCLITGAISLILIFLAYEEVWLSTLFLTRVWKRTKQFSILWKTLWGSPSYIALEVGKQLAETKPKGKKDVASRY